MKIKIFHSSKDIESYENEYEEMEGNNADDKKCNKMDDFDTDINLDSD